jgi:MFS transporter, DHA1 family, multidrug resistance protein
VSEKTKGLVVLLGALAALGAAAIDMYLAALPRIASEFGSTSGQAQFTLGAFLIGLGIGQLVHGALSDAYGRRPVLIFGILLYCVASLGCISASDINQLIAWRFVQALGAAAGSVIVRAIVRDLYSMDEGARAQSFINMAFLVTPLIAPNIGGYLLTWFGWRSIFLLMCLFGALCLAALVFRLPESLPPERRTPLSPRSLLSAYSQILRDRRTLGCLLAGTFSFACMFTFFAGSPFVYITFFGIPEQHYGLLFGINVLGIIGTNYLNARLVVRVGALRMLVLGCALCAAAGLTLAATTYFEIGALLGVVIPLVFVIGSLGFVGANALAGAMAPFPKLAGTTASLLGFSRMIFGAAAGAVLGVIHDGTPLAMGLLIGALSVLSLLSCLLLAKPSTPASS